MYTTFAAAKDFLAFQIFPFKIRHFFSCYKEISCPLGKLCKVYNRIGSSFLIGIDRCFCSHKSDICLTGNQSSQNFIRLIKESSIVRNCPPMLTIMLMIE